MHLVRFWPSLTSMARQEHQRRASGTRWWVGRASVYVCRRRGPLPEAWSVILTWKGRCIAVDIATAGDHNQYYPPAPRRGTGLSEHGNSGGAQEEARFRRRLGVRVGAGTQIYPIVAELKSEIGSLGCVMWDVRGIVDQLSVRPDQ
jgi:hypothetical protein